MPRILTACALVVAVGIMLALLRPQPVLSDETLTSLVNAAYGARTEDPGLHELAHERAQYQVTFSGGVCGPDALTHTGLVTAEVLACNYLGPARAVEQWQGSITHHTLLSGDFNLIGCGSAQGLDGAWFFACVLSSASVAQPTPAPVVPAPPDEPVPTNPPASDQPVLLPDTATEGP
jgi:hypothetical protein